MHSNQHSSTDGCFKHLFEALEDAVVKFELVDSEELRSSGSRPQAHDSGGQNPSDSRTQSGDHEPVIIEANDAFGELFGYESASVVGERLNELIVPPSKQAEARQFDQRTGTGESNAAVVERMTSDGKRKFLYRGVPYKDRYGFAIYSDVTDELQRERHLDVLHRVLRHNLRNDLTVVLGMADRIIQTTEEPETRAAAEKIREAAGQLSQLSDEATTIQRVLGDTVSLRAVDLEPLVSDVVVDCRTRFDEPTITAAVSEEVVVSADDKLQIVLRSLLDNAIRHNDSSEPQAHLTATQQDPTTVEITVADNGPGIPTTEQQLITDDKEITPLDHGSGLGLWLVKWITDSYGGGIEIETPEGGGTVVSLRLNTPNS